MLTTEMERANKSAQWYRNSSVFSGIESERDIKLEQVGKTVHAVIELPGKLYYNYSSDCNSLCSCPTYAPKACPSFTDVDQKACFVGLLHNAQSDYHVPYGHG